MSVSNLLDYEDYFRQKAVRHKLLLHNPKSENGDAKAGEKHFTKWNLNELVSGLRTEVGYPALLLELYEVRTDSQIVYDIKERPFGAFSIIQTVPEGDVYAESAAYALCEQIMTDILQSIWNDHYGVGIERCKTPFYKFDFDGLDIASTGKILANEMGWRCEFKFEFQHKQKYNQPPAAGTFTPLQAMGDTTGFLGADPAADILIAPQP